MIEICYKFVLKNVFQRSYNSCVTKLFLFQPDVVVFAETRQRVVAGFVELKPCVHLTWDVCKFTPWYLLRILHQVTPTLKAISHYSPSETSANPKIPLFTVIQLSHSHTEGDNSTYSTYMSSFNEYFNNFPAICDEMYTHGHCKSAMQTWQVEDPQGRKMVPQVEEVAEPYNWCQG